MFFDDLIDILVSFFMVTVIGFEGNSGLLIR